MRNGFPGWSLGTRRIQDSDYTFRRGIITLNSVPVPGLLSVYKSRLGPHIISVNIEAELIERGKTGIMLNLTCSL